MRHYFIALKVKKVQTCNLESLQFNERDLGSRSYTTSGVRFALTTPTRDLVRLVFDFKFTVRGTSLLEAIK